MRIVVDTNIFASAALKESSWPGMVVRWLGTFGGLLKSEATEHQAIEVLRRPYFAEKMPPSFLPQIQKIFASAELVAITETIAACRDPTDNKFLDLAVNGRADFIVSGDKDLLVLNPFRRIPIIPPEIFIEGISRHQ